MALRDEWLALADDPPEPDPDFVLLDESFHVRLAESSGNRELADILRQVNERIRVVRMHDFLTTERISKTIAEHLGIVDAVLDGDLDGAWRRSSSTCSRRSTSSSTTSPARTRCSDGASQR